MIEWILPLEIVSPNKNQHWTKRHSLNKKNANIISHKWLLEDERPTPPCFVTLQRLYNPKRLQKLWDDDNWIGGCKGIRDTIAALLVPGLAPGRADDAGKGIKFFYEQLTANTKGVRIIIMTQDEIDDTAQDLREIPWTTNAS